jgi:hypothetical protein
MTRSVFGALGLVALFVAIIVGTLAAFGAFGPKAPQGEPRPVGLEATAEATNPQATAAIGQTVTAGDLSWTVNDASPQNGLHTFTFPPKSVPGSYVSVDFTVDNISKRPVTLTEDTITLFDAEGNEFRPDPARNSTYVRPELNILFNENSLLQPGVTKEGKVYFEVLPRSSDFKVRLGESDPTMSEGEYVDLGF